MKECYSWTKDVNTMVYAHHTWIIQIVAGVERRNSCRIRTEFPQETEALELDVNHVHHLQTQVRLTILKRWKQSFCSHAGWITGQTNTFVTFYLKEVLLCAVSSFMYTKIVKRYQICEMLDSTEIVLTPSTL